MCFMSTEVFLPISENSLNNKIPGQAGNDGTIDMFKNLIIVVFGILFLAGCRGGVDIQVTNPLDINRHPEMVELTADQVKSALALKEGETFVIFSGEEEVPYQMTYDGKVIFPVQLSAKEQKTFELRKGTPSEYTVKVCGSRYPERIDDFCWENDLAGFRLYGYKEDSPSGYDFFVKRGTDLPVIKEFYRKALDPEMKKRQKEIAQFDKDSAARFNYDHMSLHVDHGYGMDCYGVGKTLGAGVAALVDNGEIVYPFCYDSYEILENGPIRFTLKMSFRPFSAGGCENIVETRVFSLDLGSHFSKTTVSYEGLDKAMPIVTGIVVQDMDGKAAGDAEKGYITYPAPTINFDKQREVDNGTIFVGNVFPSELDSTGLCYFSEEESVKSRGGAKGHMLAHSQYEPGKPFVYYWGHGWNHADIASYKQWIDHTETFAAQLRTPLSVTLK